MKEHDIHTNQTTLGKKNYWRIRICVLYIYFFKFRQLSLSSNFLFQQCHCQKWNNFFSLFPSISVMPLPQTNCNNFFFLLFRQCHCHKFIATIFFPLFRQCHYHKPSATKFFFPSYFGNAIATNSLPQFFPLYFGNVSATN